MKPSSIALAIAFALSAAPAVMAAPQAADAQFRAIHASEWKWRQSQHLEDDEDDTDAIRGELPHVDAATQLARLRHWEGVLKKLDALPAAKLSAAERINFAVYRAQIAARLANPLFR
jgi:uncharacterized protein (DUF885 family)